MIKTFKYRLYPSKKVQKTLSKTLDICRITYNNILEQRIELYKSENKSLSQFDVNNILTKDKESNPDLSLIYSQVLQNVSKRVHLAYQSFFRRVKQGTEKPGFPRFKSYNRYDSFTYPQVTKGFKIVDNWLHLNKIGKIQIKLHRDLIGDIKTCTVKRSNTGKWFVYFSTECDQQPLEELDNEVGIDLGLKTFAVFSDGNEIENPKFFIESEKRLKKIQSKFSKATKGSLERKKQGKVLCKVHEKVSNQRDNFCHQVSLKIIDNYQVICVEDLNIKKMMKVEEYKDGLDKKIKTQRHKNIGDVSWGKIIEYLKYKAEDAGRLLISVNPRNTSKMCSDCGTLVEKKITDRVHKCPHCGLVMDRDLNASLNILRLGLESLRRQALPA
jgi:putative transposase